MTTTTDATTGTIASLNDKYRQAWGVYPNAKVVMTDGISNLPDAKRSKVFEAVQQFKDFNEDNDPHGEHDFGSIEVPGVNDKVFWKFSYYDLSMDWGSEYPEDASKTVRVLTIMMAWEY
ncbi:MAG: DUF3768 domain-containing protein [Hyphomicrobiaceae bacterium]|nr:DUF3768 domain-containing protein [Hyphomicrobiaceae bacterium]